MPITFGTDRSSSLPPTLIYLGLFVKYDELMPKIVKFSDTSPQQHDLRHA